MKKVIVIGAGPAGLTAAYELKKESADYEIIILEASDRIGGISQTLYHDGNRMDIGGHRFFSKDDRVTAWWESFMPTQGAPSFDDIKLGREKPLVAGGPDPETDDNVMLVRQRVSRIYYDNKFFDYPISMKMQTFKNMGFSKTLRAGFSYLKSAIFKREETNLENFYINRFGQVLYSMFFEGYTEKLWGRHPRDISADWGAQRVKGLSIKAVLKDMFSKLLPMKKKEVETSLIEEFFYPKYGPGQLWERVAQTVTDMGCELRMNSKVTAINLSDARALSVEAGGERLDADIIISSMPLKELVLGMGDVVPEQTRKIAAGLPYRDFVTVGILLSGLKLKNTTNIKTLGNIVPDCWIYVQDTTVKMGRIQIFNNWSPYMVKNPEGTVWIGTEYFCDEGDEYWTKTPEEWRELAVAELVKMNIIDRDSVLDYHCEKIKKAYPAYFDTYKEVENVIDYVNQLGNVYCVGRNGQHRYNNMDHSMVTAFEAVRCILDGRDDKQAIWNVNTDKGYHEEKTS